MSQEVIHRPLNAEARVISQGVPLGICSEKVALGEVSFQYFRFSPLQFVRPVLRAYSFVTDAA